MFSSCSHIGRGVNRTKEQEAKDQAPGSNGLGTTNLDSADRLSDADRMGHNWPEPGYRDETARQWAISRRLLLIAACLVGAIVGLALRKFG